jgi:hypothetical protein
VPSKAEGVLAIMQGDTEEGTGDLLKADALICLLRDSNSWRSVRPVFITIEV